MARPAFSKIPERINAKARLITEMDVSLLKILRLFPIFLAKKSPSTVNPNQTPMAFTAINPIAPQFTVPPWPVITETIPRTIARIIIPNTSSITAAARTVTPSGESIFLCSDRMRAVMPTEVAVLITPRNKLTGEVMGRPVIRLPAQAPDTKEMTTPPIPMTAPLTEKRRNRERSVSSPE